MYTTAFKFRTSISSHRSGIFSHQSVGLIPLALLFASQVPQDRSVGRNNFLKKGYAFESGLGCVKVGWTSINQPYLGFDGKSPPPLRYLKIGKPDIIKLGKAHYFFTSKLPSILSPSQYFTSFSELYSVMSLSVFGCCQH